MSPVPIAATGTLKAKSAAVATVTAETAMGMPLGGAIVYLSFKPITGGGSAITHKVSLTSTPVAIKTDRAGVIKITYHAAANPQPTTGSDTLTAADAATAPKVTATDTYTYTAVSVGVASFSFTPSPVATKHTLAANKIVALSVTAKSSLGVAVPRANVWLSFVQASGGGSAYAHGLQLTSSPQVFKTDASGVIKVTYATGFTLPTTGTDTIKIANAMAGATATGTDIYSF